MSKFIDAIYKINFVMTHHCLDKTETVLNKQMVQNSYKFFSQLNDKNFLNWGFWDKKIHKEYSALNFDFAKISATEDIYSPLLLYFLIRPLIKKQWFHKRLLEVGCGNGLGLRASSELLKADYALGMDLTNQLVVNASSNFHEKDRVNYIQSDAEHLPVESESFDIITNLESSHVYPHIELFFAEVARVLAPNGYFCYADAEIPTKYQPKVLERFIKQNKKLKIIQKIDITKSVQASIYQRILSNDEHFYNVAKIFFEDGEDLEDEIRFLAYAAGLSFLPRWKVKFNAKKLRYSSKRKYRHFFWKKRHYFYYLIQKV